MAMSSTMTIDKKTGRSRRKERMSPAQKQALMALNRKPRSRTQIAKARKGLMMTIRTGRTRMGRRAKV